MGKQIVLCFVAVLSMISACGASVVRLNLTGTWTVTNPDLDITVKDKVPGSVYTALHNNDVIQEPYYRDNDVKQAWVAHANWTYTRTFTVRSEMYQRKSLLLVAEGIDTVSSVYINQQLVGTTENMFLKYAWNIRPFINSGQNTIAIHIQSATEYATQQANSYPYKVPAVFPLPETHGESHINFIRKVQTSFSWDWAPSFPTQGVWKPIYLVAFDSAVLEMATVEVVPVSDGESWVLRTTAYFHVGVVQSVSGQLQITLDLTGISETYNLFLNTARNEAAFDITVPQSAKVKRWWPIGYGDQMLYDVTFNFTTSDGEVTSQTKRIGFRTVELVQEPVSADPKRGLTFYFRVNGQAIFMKGANWIPPDSFRERVTEDHIRMLLQSAVLANMNMLRVCGVGIYESEFFFDLADELGIMIFKGLVFGDALYPTDPAFLDTVTKEVTYQVRRVMHRPSILFWTGNDESEAAIDEQWVGFSNGKVYRDDYVKLYVTTLKAIVTSENPSRVYLTTTPSNGKFTEEAGYFKVDPSSELYGDVHFYGYVVDLWNAPANAPVPRFITEYGLQSWPSYHTLLPVFEEEDMSYTSPMAVHRQHHPNGTEEIESQITRHLAWPLSTISDPQRFKSIIYLTQINQAMSIKSEGEHYRRHQSSVLPDGRGLTMGALYWQLNDIWQAPTWASIDYSGRWKMLHYYAARFYSPLLVSPYLNGSDVKVYVVVDQIPTMEVRDPHTQRLRFEPMTKVKDIMRSSMGREDALGLKRKVDQRVHGNLTVQMYSWNSFTPLHQWIVPYQLNTTAEMVFRQGVDSMMTEAGCTSSTECFIYTFLNDPNDGVNNWIYLAELKDSSVPKANVTIASVQQASSPREFTITLTTDAIAPFVWLEAGSMMGRFSDNGFLLVKVTFTVTFTAWRDDVDIHTLRSQLSVLSLMDIYRE
ncbi:beta-mannosidase-like [Littorina saxatilis]|uniref:beta-mannosidase n=1 Tax=Littorina saxatilis TaxID=31220 RepID=A0AAN9BRH5_9CAEN